VILRSPIAAKAKLGLYKLIGLSPAGARFLDVYLSRRAFRKAFGRDPDFTHPVLFGEKVIVRKLFDQRKIFRLMADKLWVRDFIIGKLGESFVPKLYAVYSRFEEIDFERLPEKFVIKPNHGTHWVQFVEDKKTLDKVAARRLVNGWMRTNYYVNSREIFYKDVKPRIMVEELLEEASGAPVIDYKFFAFDGVTRLITVARRKTANSNREAAFFDRAYREIPIQVEFANSVYKKERAGNSGQTGETSTSNILLPPNIDEMLKIADTLAQGFDFIRVDLYSPGGRILVGELTSLPAGGVRPFEPPAYEQQFGDYWKQVLS
jgi:hypothetical protein